MRMEYINYWPWVLYWAWTFLMGGITGWNLKSIKEHYEKSK